MGAGAGPWERADVEQRGTGRGGLDWEGIRATTAPLAGSFRGEDPEIPGLT